MNRQQKLYIAIIAIILAILAAYITLTVTTFIPLRQLKILPVSTYLPILSAILPILSFLTLPTLSRNFRQPLALPSPPNHGLSGTLRFNRPTFASMVILTILTVIVTFVPIDRQYTNSGLAGLKCGLDQGWQGLWHDRNAGQIRVIQDALNCCGFKTVKDRAFPFATPAGPSSCAATYGRDQACLPVLVEETRKVLWNGVLLGALSLIVWVGGGLGVGMMSGQGNGGIRDTAQRIEEGRRNRNGGSGLLPASTPRIEEGVEEEDTENDAAGNGERRGLLEGNAENGNRRYLGEGEQHVWR
ncbi:hypothetical protein BJ508DRAFT_366167 [Ascobolus immersus RN42]|uniref:Tetraspanin Tsp3 n=1 Tax=Ascobolus immersus RN42 TaxID=1160509 RepID=A0A3N4HL21_ASCIM|nr:hypothetical protein BJ508DRAFT_366167 [Ascobolus immersus RN42]